MTPQSGKFAACASWSGARTLAPGARVIAAWLNHFDSREQNSMDTWMAVDVKNADSAPGHVRHWYIDLGDCFGSQWAEDQISRRLGFSYYLDLKHVGQDFISFGAIERPWERAVKKGTFGYFSTRDFEPEDWHGGYPKPAFSRMVESDGAWAARKIARFRAFQYLVDIRSRTAIRIVNARPIGHEASSVSEAVSEIHRGQSSARRELNELVSLG